MVAARQDEKSEERALDPGGAGTAVAVAEAERRVGSPRRSIDILRLARRPLLENEDARPLAWSYWAEGTARRHLAQFGSARTALEAGYLRARAAGDSKCWNYCRAGLAELNRITGHPSAERDHLRLLAESLTLGDARGIVWAAEGVAQIQLISGGWRDAARGFTWAGEVALAFGDRRGHAWALRGYGECMLRKGRWQAALPPIEAALDEFVRLGMRGGAAWTLKSLGDAILLSGEPEHALAMHSQAALAFRAMQDERGLWYSTVGMGRDALKVGRRLDGRRCAIEAMTGFRKIGVRHGLAHARDLSQATL